jgi:protoporphyrinogen oxidase
MHSVVEPTAPPRVAIIGAGPAGLTAAYHLVRRGVQTDVFERDAQVGGLARTVEHNGFRFDIGGHRFFTKVQAVADLWRSVLGAAFLTRPRLSRIYYRRRFFAYPLKPLNALWNLGALTSISVVVSYLWAKLRPTDPEKSFADFATNRFGRRLFRIFFETYTEKVWGMPCDQIHAHWAAQRIQGLSLRVALRDMLSVGTPGVKSLIGEFEYPRHGPGMMWEAFRADVEERGGRVHLRSHVAAIRHQHGRITAVQVECDGRRHEQLVDHVISTMPVRELIAAMGPAVPEAVRRAAESLRYRDFITVALVVKRRDVFPDNWIYVHEPQVRVGRIQNFKNWSPEMVPDPAHTCLGLEYFCFEGDGLWTSSDEELIQLGVRELAQIGLVEPGDVIDGAVVRVPKAYPVYDHDFESHLATIREYVGGFTNLQLVGRNGMHKYNNQDHSMVTAMLAVENIFGARHDLWAVNADAEYQEETRSDEVAALAATQPRVPRSVSTTQPAARNV